MAQSALQSDPPMDTQNSRTLDMEFFWQKPTLYPPIPIDKWKDTFSVSLFAKVMIAVQGVRIFTREPNPFTPQEEPAPEKGEAKAKE